MPASALLLASAFLHAMWNALVRRAEDKETAPLAMVIVCMVVSIAWALAVDRGPLPPTAGLLWAVVAGVAEGAYVVSLGRALRDAPLGLAYAISRGGAMLLVWPISIVFLGERATPWALGGAAALGAGLVVASVGSTRGLTGARLGWSFATAAFIAAYHLAYGRALEAGIRSPTAVAVSITIGVAAALTHARFTRGGRLGALHALRRQPLLLGIGGILSAASFLVFLEGLQRSGAGAALSLRNTSIAFTVLFSVALGERATRRQWLGIVVVAAGAVLLGL